MKKRTIQFIPGIAWFLFVLTLICLPGKSIPQATWLNIVNFDKMVHAALFGGIVFLFCMPFKKSVLAVSEKQALFLKITLATIVWGLCTEFIQKYFIPGRQFDLMDWAADSLGAILAYIISKKLFVR